MRREHKTSGGLHLQQEDKVCGVRGKVCIIRNFASTVRGEKCSLPEGSYLQYEEKAVQDEKKVYSIKR